MTTNDTAFGHWPGAFELIKQVAIYIVHAFCTKRRNVFNAVMLFGLPVEKSIFKGFLGVA